MYTHTYCYAGPISDELLLVDGREPPPIREPAAEEMTIPTIREIAEATVNLVKRNHNRDPDPMNHSTDVSVVVVLLVHK